METEIYIYIPHLKQQLHGYMNALQPTIIGISLEIYHRIAERNGRQRGEMGGFNGKRSSPLPHHGL
jgi:hypothetical protein